MSAGLTGSETSARGSSTTDSGFTLGESAGATLGGATGATTGNTPSIAQLRLESRQAVTLAYGVTSASDRIAIQFSADGQTWRETEHTIASGSVTTGGDSVTFTTGYQFVRARPGPGYTDSQIDAIVLSAKD